MRQISTIAQLRDTILSARHDGKRVGLVPTMGYLHEGHLRLVSTAKEQTDFVVVSIFVNPLQFGPAEDLEQYPRDLPRDMQILQEQGCCDVVFTPSAQEMYPTQMATTVELPSMSGLLCGKSRPTHFAGVATVVSKLFNIVQPDAAFFGQKDGQQLAIIRRLVSDLNFPITVVGVPTVREVDGLAKSSRNIYLTAEERKHATVLFHALSSAKDRILTGINSGAELSAYMRQVIESDTCARLDYAEVVNLDTLEPVDRLEGHIMLAVAAFFGKARLIDNLQLVIKDGKIVG